MPLELPRSRRERPAKPALTRAGIVAAAVEILRAEGLQKVTMRRLAQVLDTGPASLYVYIRNTAELHAAILDEIMGAVEPPAPEGDWRERLERMLTSYTLVLFEYPSLARSALSARPSGVNYLAMVEALLALLDEGGIPPKQASFGIDALLQFATASAAEHATRDESINAQDDWDALRHAVETIDPTTHPHIARLGTMSLSGDRQDRLSWGFAMVINGIIHTPVPSGVLERADPASTGDDVIGRQRGRAIANEGP